MLERMITIFSLESVMTAISGKVDILTGAMDSYLSNSGNLRTLSIILMMLAIVLFLFLIAVLYVKSLSSFLRAEQNRRKEDEKQSKSFLRAWTMTLMPQSWKNPAGRAGKRTGARIRKGGCRKSRARRKRKGSSRTKEKAKGRRKNPGG